MSHPFTLECMLSSKTNVSGGQIQKLNGDEEGTTLAHENSMMSSQSTRICDGQSVTEGYQTDHCDQFAEIPGHDMEMIMEEINITISDNDRLRFNEITSMAMRHRMELFAQEVSILGLS